MSPYFCSIPHHSTSIVIAGTKYGTCIVKHAIIAPPRYALSTSNAKRENYNLIQPSIATTFILRLSGANIGSGFANIIITPPKAMNAVKIINRILPIFVLFISKK